MLENGMWCPRHKCNKARVCQYSHNCKAMTPQEAAVKQAEWDRARKHRELITEQEKREEQRLRDDRRGRIEAMLEAHGLGLYDLELFIKEVMS